MPKANRSKLDTSEVVITNRSRQMIPIQVRPPSGDFFYEEHQVRILPGKSVSMPRHFLNWSQIENCQARGQISIIQN